jgi:hypothetical protein
MAEMHRHFTIALAMLALTMPGCTKRFNIRPPVPSSIRYETPPSDHHVFDVLDGRTGEGLKMSFGRLGAVLVGLEEDPTSFLKQHIVQELSARGVDIEAATASTSDLNLNLTTFTIRNHRSTSLSPYYTFSKLVGILEYEGESHRITGYFKNGKVPVWAFREVEEPTYNIPVSLLVKEAATKINRIAIGGKASSAEVARISAAIRADAGNLVYRKVFELGYTGNLEAIAHLREIAKNHKVKLARAAAISCIGMLKATDQFDFLTEVYNSTVKIERAMALKSIGDLELPQGDAFFAKVAKSKDVRDTMVQDVVDLYR